MPFAESAEQGPLAKITGLRSLAKPRTVCIPVTAADLDLLPATLISVLNHTTAESGILLLAVVSIRHYCKTRCPNPLPLQWFQLRPA